VADRKRGFDLAFCRMSAASFWSPATRDVGDRGSAYPRQLRSRSLPSSPSLRSSSRRSASSWSPRNSSTVSVCVWLRRRNRRA